MTIEPQERDAFDDDAAARHGWRQVAAVATRQHGLISSAQLRAAGITREMTYRAVGSGRLFRKLRGVYSVGHEYAAPDVDLIAGLLAVSAAAVLSHRSAAPVWGLVKWTGLVEVTVPVRTVGDPRVTIHEARFSQKSDVTRRHGFPVTSVRRTLIDLAGVLSEDELRTAIHEAATKGWLSAHVVRRLHTEMAGRRGARALRRLLAERDVSKGWTRSSLETAFAALVRDAQLPPITRRLYVDIGGGDIRECDFVWEQQKVMVELDFLPLHETGFVPYRDRRRDRRLAAAGWVVIRVTGDDLEHHRDEVAADLRSSLRLIEPQVRAA